MTGQLSLFDDAPVEAPRDDAGLVLRVRALLGSRFDNFAWWCDGGNQEMCAAVLWRNYGFTVQEAQEAVAIIARSEACKTPLSPPS